MASFFFTGAGVLRVIACVVATAPGVGLAVARIFDSELGFASDSFCISWDVSERT